MNRRDLNVVNQLFPYSGIYQVAIDGKSRFVIPWQIRETIRRRSKALGIESISFYCKKISDERNEFLFRDFLEKESDFSIWFPAFAKEIKRDRILLPSALAPKILTNNRFEMICIGYGFEIKQSA